MTGFGRNPCCCGTCCGCEGKFPGDADYTECLWDVFPDDWNGYPNEYLTSTEQNDYERVVPSPPLACYMLRNDTGNNSNRWIYKGQTYSSGTLTVGATFDTSGMFSGGGTPKCGVFVQDLPFPTNPGGSSFYGYFARVEGEDIRFGGPGATSTEDASSSVSEYSVFTIVMTITPSGSDCDISATIDGDSYGPLTVTGSKPTSSPLAVGVWTELGPIQVDCFWYRDS